MTGSLLALAVVAASHGATTGATAATAAARAPDACGGCHSTALADWRASGHAAAASSPLFRAGFQVEPRRFCVDCHAPVAARAQDGIGCATCHEAARDARATAATATRDHAVALRARADLRDPAFCRDCHEFATPAFEGGAMRFTDLPMQSTFSEWLAYRSAGGDETCQSCHMPGGKHETRGAHDVDLLRRALAVSATASASGARLTLASVGVGHSFPTGDLFRHLTVEVRGVDEDSDGAWRVVDRVGRTFATKLDGATLSAHKVKTADTSLAPGVARVVSLPQAPGRLSWRVRYHFGSERDERRGRVPADELFATLATGTIAARAAP